MHLPDAAHFQKNAFKHVCSKHVCSALLLSAALVSIASAANAQTSSTRQAASSLTVEITDIKNADGEICVSLFSGRAGFPNNEEAIAEKQCIAAVETNPETTSPAESRPESPAESRPESPAESLSGENAGVEAKPELAEISESVMANIVEGLADNASNQGTDAENPSDETAGNAVTTGTPNDDVVITQAVLAITFTDVAPGTYAVSVLHDENEDGELNTGTFGIPTEGFGFSQNPEIRTGAPDFSEAAIVVVGAEVTTQVELIYY